MSLYTLIPSDFTVTIDGVTAFGVDFSGISPSIHAIQWYNTFGEIEFVWDPLTRQKPGNQEITDISPYQSYINQAEAIIEAANNPVTYYNTISENLYGGITYSLGQPYTDFSVNPQPPAGFVEEVPPTPESYQQLYWYDDTWVVSSVDPSLDLVSAQTVLNLAVQSSAAENVDTQSRIYSNYQLATSLDPSSLFCADLPLVTLDTYQTDMSGNAASIELEIGSATSVPELYNINPNVSSGL